MPQFWFTGIICPIVCPACRKNCVGVGAIGWPWFVIPYPFGPLLLLSTKFNWGCSSFWPWLMVRAAKLQYCAVFEQSNGVFVSLDSGILGWRVTMNPLQPLHNCKKNQILSFICSSHLSLSNVVLNCIILHIYKYIYMYIMYICTSSTAQGGGGSFKNRKPIGEVGCCESGMAERSHWWTKRCLISLTLSLSFSDYLPTNLPTYLSIYLPIYLCICLSIDLSLSLFHLITYLSIIIYLSVCLSISLSPSLSFICLSV